MYSDTLASREFGVTRVEWLTYAHNRKDGKVGLGDYLTSCYDITDKDGKRVSPYIEEGRNDTYYFYDLSEPDKLNDQWALEDREKMMDELRTGGIVEYHLRALLCLAIQDGHLPRSRYLIFNSW